MPKRDESGRWEKGESGNKKGRPLGSVKSSTDRFYGALFRALGEPDTVANAFDSAKEYLANASFEEILDFAEKIGGLKVLQEMVKSNKFQIEAGDELVQALHAALLQRGKDLADGDT